MYRNNSTTPNSPYSIMQDNISNIIELYHIEIKNFNNYKSLLNLTSNMENKEMLDTIIKNTKNNINNLEKVFIGITGTPIEKLSVTDTLNNDVTYTELVKYSLLSKLDTLDLYDTLYRSIPIQPYKDMLFFSIISQLKDANFLNLLISQNKTNS